MSHRCSIGVVPFIAHNVINGDDSYLEDTEESNCSKFCNEESNTLQEGWKLNSKAGLKIPGKKTGGIYGYCWIKDTFKVWVVNESQYSNVSVYNLAIVSDNIESIKKFLKDHKLKGKIEKDDAVQCWG